MLKVITVCGIGVGSSLILKMTCEKAFKQLNTKVNIEHWDMGTVKGMNFDLLVTTEAFRKNFAELDNVVDLKAIEELASSNRENIEYIKWPGMFHELHNEKERLQVLATAWNFILTNAILDKEK